MPTDIFDMLDGDKKPLSVEEIEKAERDYVIENFKVAEMYDFCRKNRVEVLVESDALFACHINYEEGKNCNWGTGIHPLSAMINGIKQYKKQHNV